MPVSPGWTALRQEQAPWPGVGVRQNEGEGLILQGRGWRTGRSSGSASWQGRTGASSVNTSADRSSPSGRIPLQPDPTAVAAGPDKPRPAFQSRYGRQGQFFGIMPEACRRPDQVKGPKQAAHAPNAEQAPSAASGKPPKSTHGHALSPSRSGATFHGIRAFKAAGSPGIRPIRPVVQPCLAARHRVPMRLALQPSRAVFTCRAIQGPGDRPVAARWSGSRRPWQEAPGLHPVLHGPSWLRPGRSFGRSGSSFQPLAVLPDQGPVQELNRLDRAQAVDAQIAVAWTDIHQPAGGERSLDPVAG